MYTDKLKMDIERRLQQFLQEEAGNRVTPNNWNWLMVTLERIFEANKFEEKKEKDGK